MKVAYIYAVFLLFAISCKSKTEQLPISKNIKAQYDILEYMIVNEVDGKLDTINKKKSILRTNKIFNKNRRYTFLATFIRDKKVISENTISILSNEERWEIEPNIQEKITYEYNYTESDMSKFEVYLNDLGITKSWSKKANTGIIENVKKIWMHPMRSNQYVTTEICPYPEVKFPLEIGKSWSSTMNLGKKWGIWSGKSGEFSYTVTDKVFENFTFLDKPLECWKVEATSFFEFGTSKLSFLFNEDYGFVNLSYNNYLNEEISFVLVNVESKK